MIPLPTIASRVLTAGPISFQRTLVKLQRMIADPACSSQLVSSVLTSDPMLSALVLSRANAALVDRAPITSMPAAVSRLGLSSVQGLLAEVSPVSSAQTNLIAAHWSLGMATGAMTRILARMCFRRHEGSEDDDLLHTCGLCHDLGNAVAHMAFPKAWRAAGQLVSDDAGGPGRDPLRFCEALRQQLGLDGAGIGTLIARAWCLPPEVTTCMRYYAQPASAPEETQALAAMVHIARELVRGCGFTVNDDAYVEAIDPDAIDLLKLRSADLEIAIRAFGEEWDELELYESALSA